MTDRAGETCLKRVVIAGGSGFVGQAVGDRLRQSGYEVVTLTRSKEHDDSSFHYWDGESVGEWARMLENATAVVNLSGAPVTLRWTEQNRVLIRDSRVKSTTAIGRAVRQCKIPPKTWVNASGVGIYGDGGDVEFDESSPMGEGFLAETCLAWENAQSEVQIEGMRKVRLRMGVVLGRQGGAFPELEKYARWFLGGAQGSGRHWMSWIHIDDLAEIYKWAIESGVEGVVNAVSPDPIRNSDFMDFLRKAMGRPWSPPAPMFAIQLVGAMRNVQADVILQSQRVNPSVLKTHGFPFKFHDLSEAFADLLTRD